MSIAYAVIGANWGDEGKGLATDAMAHRLAETVGPVTVVRSNGGAQAGHGVERPGGLRHVFHHVGAGTMAHAATHLSQFFVAHPMLLVAELTDLRDKGAFPKSMSIDPRAPATTPWDMAINQCLERSRGMFRHGSTGMGFGETIERMENGPRLTAADLRDPDLASILREIRDCWSIERLDALGIEDMGGRAFRPVFDPKGGILERFMQDIETFNQAVFLRDDADLGRDAQILFEGAQGLRLDMDQGEMPHVTRSNTGLKNMLIIAEEAGIERIAPFYMTRAYATRHGAGPLPHEAHDADGIPQDLDWADVVDETNAPNTWQGHIRQAVLDVDILKASIDYDLALAKDSPVKVFPSLGVTCLDQIRGQAALRSGNSLILVEPHMVSTSIAMRLGMEAGIASYGPTREDVHWNRFGHEDLQKSGTEDQTVPDPS